MDAERWQRLKHIYSMAMDRPAAERPGYVAASCEGDLELESEIVRLLQPTSGDDFLEDPSAFITDILPEPESALQPEDMLSRRFVIRRFIARGGMGEVFEAFDSELKENVALKTVRAEIAGIQPAVEQFKREVQRARSIGSEYVCRVYDLFIHDGGGSSDPVTFLTMELLQGETLGDRLARRGAFPIEEAMRLLTGIAHGLAAAHRESIVHGDLKLSNIMLVHRDDGELIPKITDFGLAVRATAAADDDFFAGAGTPGFMAPEQIAGAIPTPSSDVYSFGVIAAQVLQGPAAKEDRVAAISRTRELPKTWRRALVSCLHRESEKRPRSAVDLVRELDGSAKRHGRRYVLTGVVTGTAAAISMAYFKPQGHRGTIDGRIAVLPFIAEAGSQAYFAAAVTEEVACALARAPGLAVIGRDTMDRFRGSRSPVAEIARAVNAAYLIAGFVRRDRGRLSIRVSLQGRDGHEKWSKSYDGDERDIFSLRDRAAADIGGELGVHVASMQPVAIPPSLNAHDLYWQGRFHWRTRSDAALRTSLDYFRKAIAVDPRFALAYAGLADSYAVLAERALVPAGYGLSEAKRAAEMALALDKSNAAAYVSRAHVASVYDRDFRAAEAGFRQALTLEPRSAPAHQWYSYMLMKLRRFDEARQHALNALDVEPLSIPALGNHAVQSYYAARFDECVAQCRKLLALNPSLFWYHCIIGLVLARSGLRSEAMRELEQIPAPLQEHVLTVRTRAEVHGLFGEYAEARGAADVLVERRRAQGLPASWVAAAMAASKQSDAAFEWLDRAYNEFDAFASLVDIYPAFDSIRADPRYPGLLRKLGLRA